MTVDDARLLWVARETGALEALLSTAGTPAEVAAETGLSERAARILTLALADRGVLERVGDAYEPADRSLGFLARADVRSIGRLPHEVDLLAALAALPDRLDAGDPPLEPEHATINRLGATVATDESTVRAAVTAAVREHPGADRVLDVGGAPGVYAAEFVARGFDVTLCDRPERVGPSRPFLATDPVDAVEIDYDDPGADLPAADLAFVPGASHRLPPEGNRALLANLRSVLDAGGTAVLVDHVRGRSPQAATVAVEALATTAGGDTYTEERYREWLLEAGFQALEIRAVPGTDRQAIVGTVE